MGRSVRRGRLIARILTYVGVLFFLIFALGPFAWAVVTAFKSPAELYQVPIRWVPEHPTLDGFRSLFRHQPVGRQFLNSLMVAGAASCTATLLAVLAGYGFSRYRFRRKQLLLSTVLAGQMMPGVVLILPYFILLRRLGLTNTYWGLILAYVSFALPLAVWLMRGFFAKVPRELDESAMVDGCTRLQALWRTVLPVAAPGISATLVFTFLTAWSEYLFALVLTTDRNMQLLTAAIGSMVLQYGIAWNELMSLALIAIVPVAVLFLLVERQLIQGLTGGAVKE